MDLSVRVRRHFRRENIFPQHHNIQYMCSHKSDMGIKFLDIEIRLSCYKMYRIVKLRRFHPLAEVDL